MSQLFSKNEKFNLNYKFERFFAKNLYKIRKNFNFKRTKKIN